MDISFSFPTWASRSFPFFAFREGPGEEDLTCEVEGEGIPGKV